MSTRRGVEAWPEWPVVICREESCGVIAVHATHRHRHVAATTGLLSAAEREAQRLARLARGRALGREALRRKWAALAAGRRRVGADQAQERVERQRERQWMMCSTCEGHGHREQRKCLRCNGSGQRYEKTEKGGDHAQ